MTGCDTLYWDGNTEGLIADTSGEIWVYKVSDVVPTTEDIMHGATISLKNYPGGGDLTHSFSPEELQEMSSTGYITDDGFMLLECVVIVPTDNYGKCFGLDLPEKGVYLLAFPQFDCYVNFFRINGYTGFSHSENCGH